MAAAAARAHAFGPPRSGSPVVVALA